MYEGKSQNRSAEYRRRAQECLLLANTGDSAARSHSLDWALCWFRLAEQADKNSGGELADARPQRGNELGFAVGQDLSSKLGSHRLAPRQSDGRDFAVLPRAPHEPTEPT
jgi:hypothetical protein